MAQLTISFATDNDAFASAEDAGAGEVSRVLDTVMNRIYAHSGPGNGGYVFDVNGNRIGSWEWTAQECACNPIDGEDPRCELHGSDQ